MKKVFGKTGCEYLSSVCDTSGTTESESCLVTSTLLTGINYGTGGDGFSLDIT